MLVRDSAEPIGGGFFQLQMVHKLWRELDLQACKFVTMMIGVATTDAVLVDPVIAACPTSTA